MVALLFAVSLAAFACPVGAQTGCDSARCEVAGTIEARCPCQTAQTHGEFVRCVSRALKALVAGSRIPAECRGTLKRCAARSTCGRETGTVVCEIPVGQGRCRVGLGFCEEPLFTPCSSDADCVTSRCAIVPSTARCTARGGMVASRRSCCPFCAPTTPCGPGLHCDGAGEVCVSRYPVGPAIVYACEPVPNGCEIDRSCACAGPALCQGAFDTCHDAGPNAIACECPQCQ